MYDVYEILHTHDSWGVKMRGATMCGVLAVLVSGGAVAHDLWLEREASGYTLYQGHRYSSHGGAETQPYDAAAVREILCVGDDGKAKAAKLQRKQTVRAEGSCSALLANYVSGYWTKTAWETKNQPKTGVSGVLKSWHSQESVKRIDRWLPSLSKPVGDGLELSPQSDPLALKAGDKLVVLASDRGQPLAGVPVAYAGETRGATGADGKIAIRLRQGGMQLIAASVETPLNDGKADQSVRATALQFEIAK